MPRNSSGTYTLPAGNPVVTGTTISSTWANTTLSDIGTALTDSLSRSGDGGMTAPLQLTAGAVGAPGLSWSAETTSGLYRAGAGDFRYSISSSDILRIQSTGLSVTGNISATGTISGSNFTGLANPSASIGLTAVNGSATTAMRSDAAPALSQSIVPTWTAKHTFTAAGSASADTLQLSSTLPMLRFTDTDAGADLGQVQVFVSGSAFTIRTTNDANTVANTALSFSRDTSGPTSLTFGNTSTNPTYSFAGTGAASFGGAIRGPDGGASAPSLSFASDTDSGVYLESGTGVAISFAGARVATFRPTLTQIDTGVFRVPDGAVAVPSYTFASDQDTGFYRDTADQIGIALGGVTAGQIAQGSFTGTATGLTTSPTGTFTWVRIGKHVFIRSGGVSGVSNTTSFTITGLPASIRRSSGQSITKTRVINNGTTVNGEVIFGTTDTIIFNIDTVSGGFVAPISTGFTNSGVKGVSAGDTWYYQLD